MIGRSGLVNLVMRLLGVVNEAVTKGDQMTFTVGVGRPFLLSINRNDARDGFSSITRCRHIDCDKASADI